MKSLHSESLRQCLDLLINTPSQAVYALAAELPPIHRSRFMTGKELTKIFFYNQHLKGSITNSNVASTSYDLLYVQHKSILDKIVPFEKFDFSPRITIGENPVHKLGFTKGQASSAILKTIYAEKVNDFKTKGFYIYATDGSVTSNSSGFAIVNVSDSAVRPMKFRIKKVLTSFTTELLALQEALKDGKNRKQNRIAVFTDSLSSCLALKNDRLNYIVKNINKLAESFTQVIFQYIPSHKGNSINEKADEAAKAASENGTLYNFMYTLDEAQKEILKISWEEWNQEFQELSQNKGLFFHNVYPSVKKKTWFKNTSLNAQEVKTINRLITNTAFNKSNMFWFDLPENRMLT